MAPPAEDFALCQPGILFCLRQRGGRRATQVNPLAPHYLVYVLDDGNVRLTFAQPKQALELFRALAAGHATAYDRLCDAFDKRTEAGADMEHENKLLDKAIASIQQVFERRAAGDLFSGREGILPTAEETPEGEADLELVTWLVIMEGVEDR